MGAGERASTEKNRADRASSVRVVNADEAAGSGFVDGHFRDDGDAHVRADHREETGKVATFKNDAGVEAGAVAGGDRSFAEAVSIAEKKKRIEAQIGETKRGSTSELVLFGEPAKRRSVRRGKDSKSLPRMGSAKTAMSMAPARRRPSRIGVISSAMVSSTRGKLREKEARRGGRK